MKKGYAGTMEDRLRGTFCGIVSRRCVTRTISSVRERRHGAKGVEGRGLERKLEKEVKWGRSEGKEESRRRKRVRSLREETSAQA